MPTYKKVLVAIDLTEEAPQVLNKAMEVCKAHQAELVLVHVVEPVGYAYGGDIPMDLTELQDQLDKAAREQLTAYGAQYDVREANQVVSVGRPESEIHRLAKEHGVDLVIVGSHGRKGFQLLLGSTANGVLHGTECDVLAVRGTPAVSLGSVLCPTLHFAFQLTQLAFQGEADTGSHREEVQQCLEVAVTFTDRVNPLPQRLIDQL